MRERAVVTARVRHWLHPAADGPRKRRKVKDTPPLYDTAQARAVSEAGGVLICARLVLRPAQNGGCGGPTYVDGTNGGEVECGAFVTQLDGSCAPYYCAACDMRRKDEKAQSVR